MTTKTNQSPATKHPNRGPAWAVAAFVGVLAVAAVLFFAFAGDGTEVAGPTPTTAPPTTAVTEPTPTSTPPTTAPAATRVVSEPNDGVPGITATTPPSGWTLETDLGGVFKADVADTGVLLWSFPAGTEFSVPADPCRSDSTMPFTPATTPDEIGSALAAQTARYVSAPVAVTIDGYAGLSLTLHVPGDAVFADCESTTFLMYATGDDPGARTHQGPGQVDELWILDVDGSVVIIDAMYRPDTPAVVIEELRSIARSATFQPAG